MRLKRLFLTVLTSIFSLSLVQAKPEISPESNTKNVLYLSSSEIECQASLEQMKQLTKAFPENTKFVYQYVNYSESYSEDEMAGLHVIYKKLISDVSVDLIVAADNLALSFVKNAQDDLFMGIPVLVLGMSKGQEFDEALKMMSTHIVMDSPYIEENIKLINSLFPRRRRIVFVGCDDSQKEALQSADFKFDIDSEFKNISGMSVEELKQFASGLDKCSILFLPSAFDMNKFPVKAEEAL
ncbi:MAG: hypothetical protein VZQ99_03245, partial [Treponema sp.]|nr:hypothetical protein [Treponema sp.]